MTESLEDRQDRVTPSPEALLADRARRGDADAFGRLYQRYAPMVHAVLLAGTRHREVEDLMQDVFLAAWRGIQELRESHHVGAWLATIARNRARGAGRRRPLETLTEEPVDREGTADATTAEGMEILSILRGLPKAYRETLTMRLVEQMSGQEIAAATGLTHGSVRVNLHRGMKLLREELRKEGYA